MALQQIQTSTSVEVLETMPDDLDEGVKHPKWVLVGKGQKCEIM